MTVNNFLIFETRDFWSSMGILQIIRKQRFKETFGTSDLHIRDVNKAIEYLKPIMETYQDKILEYIKNQDSEMIVVEIYKIFQKCFSFYIKEKKDRQIIVSQKIMNEELLDIYAHNRNIAMNIITACNIWLENCVLLQEKPLKKSETNIDEIDSILMVDLYIYGAVSITLSLLSLSKNHEDYKLYYGIDVLPDTTDPITAYRDHPVIYHNYILGGNQNVFEVKKIDYEKANDSVFGKAFFTEYGVPFLESLRIMASIQKNELQDGHIAFIGVSKKNFYEIIEWYSQGNVDKILFFETFTLTKDKLHKSKRKEDKTIWKIGVNKERHELRPFLCFDEETVLISYCAIEQTKQIWLSFFANGGVVYTNNNDKLTLAGEERCQELSNSLVDIIIGLLNRKFKATFSDKNVDFKRIFGEKEDDYGDYDIVFYSSEIKELFLIEAKYFSDSLNASGIINDYEKLYSENGYYYHCRKRYDLVLSETEKMRKFIGVNDEIVNVHMLFVSSKPLEIDFQDSDEVVTFVPLCIFEDYLDGKLVSEDGSKIMRPVKII